MNPSSALRKFETLASVPIGRIARNTIDASRLSPAGFSRIADISLYGKFHTNPKLRDLREANVIFLSGHNVGRYKEEFAAFARPKVLILGDGDRDWTSTEELESLGVSLVLAQNLLVENSTKVQLLPIGIENRLYGRNGMPWHFRDGLVRNPKRSGLFFGPLGLTHPVRKDISMLDLKETDRMEVSNQRQSTLEFSYRSSRWSHVAAPRGNGQDTHRFWESLYRGSVPVIVSDTWASNLTTIGIPFEPIEEWSLSEIRRVSEKPTAVPTSPEKIPALWQPFWIDLIKKAL